MRGTWVCATALIAVITTASCKKHSLADDKLIVTKIDVPAEKNRDSPPNKPGAATYCSIEQNGSYDIPLKDSNGNTFATLDRVCANYGERYTAKNGRYVATHVIQTTINTTVKSSSRRVARMFTQTEFYNNPSTPTRTRLWLSGLGNPQGWGCSSTPTTLPTLTNVDDIYPPDGPSILDAASSTATLHFTIYSYSHC